MRRNYYGARALAGLQALGEVRPARRGRAARHAGADSRGARLRRHRRRSGDALRSGPIRSPARSRRRLPRCRRHPQHRRGGRERARRARDAGEPQLGAGGERAGDRADDRRGPRHLARRCRLQGGARAAGRHGTPARRRNRRHHRLWPPRPARRRAGAGLRHDRAGERPLRHRRARRTSSRSSSTSCCGAPTSSCRWRWQPRRPRT